MRLDELSSIARLERRTTEDILSRRIVRLVPVFILETHNRTNNECLPKFVQTDNATSSITTANPHVFRRAIPCNSLDVLLVQVVSESHNIRIHIIESEENFPERTLTDLDPAH